MAIANTNTAPILVEGSNITLTQSGQTITIDVPNSLPVSRFNGYAYAVWSGTGLVFDVYWPSYYIDSILYSAGSGQITLDTADPTNPRLDVIAMDSTGPIKISGTAAANPVKPTVNVMSQLEITTVLVNAGATTPAITDTTVYKENTEWTGASNNGNVTFNNTSNPFAGTYCVNSGSFNNTHYIRFTAGSTYSVGDFGLLKFYLRLSAVFGSTTYINVRLFNNTTSVTSIVSITTGTYNFNRNTINSYQQIIIPMSAFSFTASLFNRVEFTFAGSNTSGFKMDNIIFQTSTGTAPTGVLTGVGDANYVTKWTGVTSLGNSLLYDNSAAIGVGTISPAASSIFDLTSTSKGFLMPRMTETQRDAITSPATGLEVYNTTTNKINFYNGTAWSEVGAGGGGTPGGSDTQVQFNDGGAFGGDAGLTYDKTNNILDLESIDFATTPTAAAAVYRVNADDSEGSLNLGLKGGNVNISLGSEVIIMSYNAEATTLNKGEVVYLFGAQGQRPAIKRASNTGDATSATTFGMVAESIASGAEGFVIQIGVLRNINTNAYNEGDILWLGATAGTVTTTKPYAPNHGVFVGVVLKKNATSGRIFVKPQNGYEMDELHNVSAQSPANNDILAYNTSTNLWEKKQLSAISGITGTGITNELAYFTGTSTLASLSTTTYPSLTELSYLKGVTSAIQTQFTNKANLASPAFTGTPTAPTASVNTNTTQIATTAFVQTQIANEASIANVGAKLYLFNSY